MDTIEVAFPAPIVKVTKREILRKIAKIYDRSGLDSLVTLAGKMLYRETCDARLIRNCRAKHQQRIPGPITTQEICRQKKFWEKGTQVRCQGTSRFQDDQQRLNLQKNADRLYKCRGGIQGYYPIYLPDDALFSKRLVLCVHLQTLHEGISLTMAKIREKSWIPRLRRLTKRVINECLGCKRFQVTALASPPTGNRPKERTEGSVPFKAIGVDLAGPIEYFSKNKGEMKANILLYVRCSTCAVCLVLLPDDI